MIRSHIRPHARGHIRYLTDKYLALLKPPTGVSVGVSGSDIVVTYDAALEVDSYNIYYSIDGGAWTLSGNEATTTYSFTPTTPGEYNFRVTSVRGSDESAPSAETLYDEMMTQVYSDTITGLRISAVDGTAFVDGDDESVYESDFSSGLDGWIGRLGFGGETATFTHNVDEVVLAVTSVGTNQNRPLLEKTNIFTDSDPAYHTLQIEYTVNSGTAILSGYNIGGVYTGTPNTLSGSGVLEITQKSVPPYPALMLYFDGRNTFNLSIHSITGTKHPAMSISADYADGNHLLEIEDSLGNVASGVLSAQGTGEVLGSELVTNGGFDADTDWTKDTGWLIENGVAKCDGTTSAELKQPVTVIDLWLTKTSYTVPSYTSGLLYFSSTSVFGRTIQLNNAGDSVLYSTLLDADNVQGFRFITNGGSGWSGHLDNVSFKQVTAPSTSGALIVSEIDGATQNFVSIPAGFTYNAASYLVRVKKILPTA